MKKPLEILFDANPLVNGNKSGVGYYTFYLIDSLAKRYPEDIKLTGHYFSFFGRKSGVDLPKAPNISYVESRIIPGKVLSLTRRLGFQLPLELFFKRSGDAALFTNFVSLPSIFKIPKLVAIHDLCFEDVPQYVTEKNRRFLHRFVPRSAKSATTIITISKSTQRAIESHYNIPAKKFFITPIPPGKQSAGKTIDLKKFGIKEGYVLFVSTLEPRKNVIGLVKGYTLLPEHIKKNYPLVLVGGTGWHMEENLQYITDLQQKGENIILTGYVSNDERASLYSEATLFVMPSHYEGFGMPILEAMSYEIPTAVSDIDVFHEVAGDASMYFNKDDSQSIANVVEQLLTDPKACNDLVKKGKTLLRTYDWEKVVEELYQEILRVTKR
jgi:glycosyltransferase involved in cell wall biosynthesis